MRRSCGQPVAFSLIELLAGMGIMTVVIAIALPFSAQMVDAHTLSGAGQTMQNQLAMNRQLAIARNCPVELRFYEVPGAMPNEPRRFRMCQSWIYDAQGHNARPAGKIITLPKNVILDAKAVAGGAGHTVCTSTLIDEAPNSGEQAMPQFGNSPAPYRAFSFRGNGMTNLNMAGASGGNTWFLTIRLEKDQPAGANLPKNYFCVQVDPLTGQIKTFRP